MEERMDRRIARLALARFRVGGFVGTSIADLAGALGVSKAAIYYHYRSKDALLHRLVDPLLDAIDACIQDHNQPTRTARPLLAAYLTVLIAHRKVVPLVATDVAVLNHPTIGPRLRAQNQRLRTLLVAPDTSMSAMGPSRGSPRGDLASPDRRAAARPHRRRPPAHAHRRRRRYPPTQPALP
jgi:AcrR family transcriptional regulator